MEKRNAEREIHKNLRMVAAGNAEARAWLYDTFSGPLFRRLRQRYQYLSDPDIEDLLHDGFLLFFRDQGQVFQVFLQRVPEGKCTETDLERRLWDLVCGLATNWRRSAQFRKHLPLDRYEEPASEIDTEKDIIDRDMLTQLDDCVQKRNPRTYLYYKLRHRDGLSPEEIARATGWSKKATYKLKQVLNEALSFCAKLLGLSMGGR